MPYTVYTMFIPSIHGDFGRWLILVLPTLCFLKTTAPAFQGPLPGPPVALMGDPLSLSLALSVSFYVEHSRSRVMIYIHKNPTLLLYKKHISWVKIVCTG